jgi:hypothetical protein
MSLSFKNQQFNYAQQYLLIMKKQIKLFKKYLWPNVTRLTKRYFLRRISRPKNNTTDLKGNKRELPFMRFLVLLFRGKG